VTFDIDIDGVRRRVTVARTRSSDERVMLRLSWSDADGQTQSRDVEVSWMHDGVSWRETTGRIVDAVIVPAPDAGYAVHIRGISLTASLGSRRRHAGAPDQGDPAHAHAVRLVAPLPGRIVRVLVAVGDDVLARQDLVVIEAMKMENALVAPRAGRVREVMVAEGSSVEAGRLLLVIE
jgi:biotin carboxyl carrier protein